MRPWLSWLILLIVIGAAIFWMTRPAAPPNIVIIGIDTLRADRLGCYGAEGNPTPNLDRFAGEASVFSNASASAPWTLPSFASMFTGLYPEAHGVMQLTDRLPFTIETLAERLSDGGYRTAAFTAGGYLKERFGLDQGFDLFDEETETGKFREKIPRAIEWMESGDEEPFLLLLHGYDVHSPYSPDTRPEAPGEYIPPDSNLVRDFVARIEEDRSVKDLDLSQLITAYLTVEPPDQKSLARFRKAYQSWAKRLGFTVEDQWSSSGSYATDLAWVKANYDAEVTQLDSDLKPLLDYLERPEVRENTIVVVVSDHGESFMEHGVCDHEFVDEEVAHVPLMIRAPGVEPGVSTELVRGIDLYPTLLDLCHLDPPSFSQGRSLRPLMEGEGMPAASACCFQNIQKLERDPEVSLREGSWKLVTGGRFTAQSKPYRLFDLSQDPDEKRDVSSDHPDRVQLMLKQLAQIRKQSERFRAMNLEQGVRMDPETLEELTALGYLGHIEASDSSSD